VNLTPGIIHATDDLVRNDLIDAAMVVLNCAGIDIGVREDRDVFNRMKENLAPRTIALLQKTRRTFQSPARGQKRAPHQTQPNDT
jgi:hypothetical protein